MVKMGILNRKAKAFWLSVTFLLVAFATTAQQVKKIDNVKGEWTISNDITPMQARDNAINQAKVEALRKAGVPEFISESSLIFKSDNQTKFKEFFESIT